MMIMVDFFVPATANVENTVTSLFQLLCKHPEIQKKIHEEIDNVVGHGRLPTLDDRIKYEIEFIKNK